jgi:succinate dehydrogenase/fumarate reductase iron-sulfur protein
MAESTIKATIFRFDPGRDASPRYEDYEVPRKEEGMLVGDVLTYLYENVDPSLAFRWECRARQCGACGVMINGKAGLICKERAPDVMCLEPLQGRRVIRDLVVDLGEVTERLNSWFELEGPRRAEQPSHGRTGPGFDKLKRASSVIFAKPCAPSRAPTRTGCVSSPVHAGLHALADIYTIHPTGSIG